VAGSRCCILGLGPMYEIQFDRIREALAEKKGKKMKGIKIRKRIRKRVGNTIINTSVRKALFAKCTCHFILIMGSTLQFRD
jgi:hypothetical protein